MDDRRTGDAADPLRRRFVTDGPGIGGRIKVRPEDFLVEEIPLYEPCGEGEHLYLRVRKRNVAHNELMSVLRRTFGVDGAAIGYAGMKDKRAVTTQTVSIRLPDPSADDCADALDHERIVVLWRARHRNKIRLGHHAGNLFVVRIRDVDPLRAPLALRTLRRLEAEGAPGHYGPQRFGYRLNNHLLGRHLLRGEHEAALAELVGTGGSPFPEYQRERRRLFDDGRFAEALAHWTPADRAERIACRARAEGGSPRDAIRAIGRITLDFWVASFSSAVFNRVLDERIAAGTLRALVPGDLAWKHDSRAVFPVDAELLAGGTLGPRLAKGEIVASGPIWGAKMRRAGGAVDETERAAAAALGLDPEVLLASRRIEGARRPFLAPLRHAAVEGGFDEHGGYVQAKFDLPRGMFATVALAEIMKVETAEDGETRADGDDGGGDDE